MHPQPDRVIDFHLFGELSYDSYLRLQRRLVYEAESTSSRRIVVLLCEHPELITVGRRGSRAHIKRTDAELKRDQLAVRWVNRSGGCILHAPGQLAIYCILPLDAFGWSVEAYTERLRRGIEQALDQVVIPTTACGGGLAGRTGLLAALGVASQNQVTFQGAYLNVNPSMARFRFVDSWVDDHAEHQYRTMSCLLAERRLPVRMSRVRSSVVAGLVDAFGCDRHHLHTGHPWLSAQGPTLARAC